MKLSVLHDGSATINEALRVPGLKFFQDYILPNTTRTKNKLYKMLGLDRITRESPGYGLVDLGEVGFVKAMEKRIKSAYAFGGIHAIQIPVDLMMIAKDLTNTVDVTIYTAVALANLYCVLNQIDIYVRLKHLLNRAERRNVKSSIEDNIKAAIDKLAKSS